MKPHPSLLTVLVLLGSVVISSAQTTPPPQAALKNSAQALPPAGSQASGQSRADKGGTFNLPSAPLGELVEHLQQSASDLKDSNGAEVPMPNVIFGPGTEELPVAAVHLRNVTPVQALALLAAAAGCTLEPITSPKEGGTSDTGSDTIIGYRFTTTPMTQITYGGKSPRTSMVPSYSANPKSAGGFMVVDNPGSPLSLVRVTGAESQTADRGASRGQPVPPVEHPVSAFTQILQPPKPDEQTVRVYALGSFLRGLPKELSEKEASVLSLIQEALERAGLLSSAQPNLSFHSGSKTLIVKANAAQHEIIDQIMKALKENEESESGSTALRK